MTRANWTYTVALLSLTGCTQLAKLRPGLHPTFNEFRTIHNGEPVAVRTLPKDDIVAISSRGRAIQGIPMILEVDKGTEWRWLANRVSISGAGQGATKCDFFLLGKAGSQHNEIVRGFGYMFPTEHDAFFRDHDVEWTRAQRWNEAYPDSQPIVIATRLRRPILNRQVGGRKDTVTFVGVTGIKVGGARYLGDDVLSANQIRGISVEREPPFPHLNGINGWTVSVDSAVNRIDSIQINDEWLALADEVRWSVRSDSSPFFKLYGQDPKDITDTSYAYLADLNYVQIEQKQRELLRALDFTRTPASAVLLVAISGNEERCVRTGYDYELMFSVPTPDPKGGEPVDVVTEYPFRLERHSILISAVVGTLILGALLYWSGS